MTMLATLFREKMEATKDFTQSSEMTFSVSYPTGLLPLDCVLGYVQETSDDVCTYELGLSDGSINTLIGFSGTGKTSLLTLMACNIIKRFKTSTVFMDQAEVGTHIMRLKNITNITNNKDFVGRFIIRDAGITTESIHRRILTIHNIKTSNPKKFLYNTGIIGLNGEPVMKFEPTIYIVDSVKLVLSEKNSESEETNNMTGATNAKATSEYFTKMVPLCRMANIIMILVNHIVPRMSTSFFPEKPEFPFLKPNEHLPNGKLLQHISNTMIRLDAGEKFIPGGKVNPYNIDGSRTYVDLVKSRTSKSGRSKCGLIFDQGLGYDPDLSMIDMLNTNKILEGSNASRCKIPGYDSIFNLKNFKQILYTDPEFRKAFNTFSAQYIMGILSDEYERIKKEKMLTSSAESSYDSIIDMMSKPTTVKDIENRNKSNNYNNTTSSVDVEDSDSSDDDINSVFSSLDNN